MDDATAKELGLEALAVGFRWAPGVKLGSADETYRLTLAWYSEDATPIMHPAGDGIGPGWGWPADGSGWWPDLRDPATLGVLLAQVREAWGCDWLTCQPLLTEGGVHGWRAVGTSAQSDHTEAHALVAALKAAKGVGDE